MSNVRTKRRSLANVMEWITSCISQAEADGYQQNEDAEWQEDAPEWFDVDQATMKIRHGGWVFTMKLTAQPDR